jgi:hypothetical protein
LKPVFQLSICILRNDWITQGIKISCKCKRSLYIYSRNSNVPNTRKFYIKYCKILNVIKKAKKQHYSRFIAKSDNEIKTAWNTVKRETGKVHLTEQIPSAFTNNGKVKDPETVANVFNHFFLTITERLNLCKMGKENAISFLKDAFPATFPDIKIISTTETEIKL